MLSWTIHWKDLTFCWWWWCDPRGWRCVVKRELSVVVLPLFREKKYTSVTYLSDIYIGMQNIGSLVIWYPSCCYNTDKPRCVRCWYDYGDETCNIFKINWIISGSNLFLCNRRFHMILFTAYLYRLLNNCMYISVTYQRCTCHQNCTSNNALSCTLWHNHWRHTFLHVVWHQSYRQTMSDIVHVIILWC